MASGEETRAALKDGLYISRGREELPNGEFIGGSHRFALNFTCSQGPSTA